MAGKRRNVRALAIAVLTPLGGCASILSNEINRRHLEPFGGTLLDALVITAPFNPTMWRNIASEPWSVVLWPIALVDLPFSLVFDLVTLPVALARAASSESSEDDERPEPPAPAPPGTPAPGPAQPPVPEVAPVASWHVAGIVFARKDDAPPETLPVGIHARPLPRLTEREGLRPVSFERCHCSVRPRLPDGSTGELLDPYVFWPDARVPGSLHVSGREREALSLLHVRIVVPGYSAVEGDVPAHGTFVAVVEETR